MVPQAKESHDGRRSHTNAGVSAGQSDSPAAPGADGGGSTVPVQQRDGERGDGDCPFKDRRQQARPGEAAPDARSVAL